MFHGQAFQQKLRSCSDIIWEKSVLGSTRYFAQSAGRNLLVLGRPAKQQHWWFLTLIYTFSVKVISNFLIWFLSQGRVLNQSRRERKRRMAMIESSIAEDESTTNPLVNETEPLLFPSINSSPTEVRHDGIVHRT